MATKSLQILGSLNQTAVQFIEQALTEEEKAQARENVGAAGLDNVGKLLTEQLPDNVVMQNELAAAIESFNTAISDVIGNGVLV